jgi:hypothetical protein
MLEFCPLLRSLTACVELAAIGSKLRSPLVAHCAPEAKQRGVWGAKFPVPAHGDVLGFGLLSIGRFSSQ